MVTPDGKEFAKFAAADYLKHVAEHVEPWSYIKFCYLKKVGWKGFKDGAESGVYAWPRWPGSTPPTAWPRPLAQEAYEEYFATLGGKPVHHTLANHWARVVELLYAAERMQELAERPGDHRPQRAHASHGDAHARASAWSRRRAARSSTTTRPTSAGVITKANLIVATQNNAARIAMSVEKAAKGLISQGQGGRRHPEQDRDGLPRLRPLPRLRHPRAAGRACRCSSTSAISTAARSTPCSATLAGDPQVIAIARCGNSRAAYDCHRDAQSCH